MKSFASDNYSGAHPKILKALINANVGHEKGYGDDRYSIEVRNKFNDLFDEEVGTYFVFNGTGANTLAIQLACQSFHAVLCSNTAHINVDECGAPEKITGTKLIIIPTRNGKLTPSLIYPYLAGFGNPHHSQPRLISISQITELGTCYSVQEIKDICSLAHEHGLLVHMDGARISNAAAYLNIPVKEFTNNVGVDLLSFGGTKNGLLFGEALIVFNESLNKHAHYFRKQMTQLHSKMRFISAQYIEYLEDDLWLDLARNSNDKASKFAEILRSFPELKFTQEMQGNGLFIEIPYNWVPTLQEKYPFYLWNETKSEARLMCSFDTTDEDIYDFVRLIDGLKSNINI